MKTSKLIGITLGMLLATFSANAQLVLTNFSNYAADADIVDITGWDTAITQNASTITVTNGGFTGAITWFDFGASDYSAFDQVQLTASGISGTTVINFEIQDDLAQVLATGSFSAGSLTGLATTVNLNILGDLSNSFIFKLSGDGLNSVTGTFDNLALVSSIPEPSTYALLALGAGALLVLRRRKASAQS